MQVSLPSKPIFNRLPHLSWSQLKYSVSYLLKHKRPRKMGLWLSGSMGATLMLAWDPKLVVATLVGMGLMGAVYWGQTAKWQSRWRYVYEFSQSFQGKLAIAVISGGLGTIGSYIALYIWSHAQNRWLATGLILQGLGTFLTLGLLSWQLFDKPRTKQENQYQEWVSQLTDSNELKRLIAVENLVHLLEEKRLNSTQIKQLFGYFRLMLKQENNTMICQAMLRCFQRLEEN
ncbi:MAG: hypothetical protein AB4063_01490 [Crocosphaera sp.]